MSPSGPALLRHILDEAEYLLDRSQGLSREEFLRDETLRREFVRSLEIIGEATKPSSCIEKPLPDRIGAMKCGPRGRPSSVSGWHLG
jgi:uncharacterized protein with HEPN domain